MKNNKFAFLDYLLTERLDVFTPDQVKPFLGAIDTKTYVFLDDLVKSGWLTRLKKGLYARNPMEHRGASYLPNWHKVVEGIVYPKEYYIGFYSALQIHDLITQPSLREYAVVKDRVHPKIQVILEVPFEFIYFKPARFFGFKKTWINDHDKVYCSDVEKTIIDGLLYPQFTGGLEGLVKAVFKAKDQIQVNVLVEYAIRFEVQAVLKRLGYILEKLELFPIEQKILNQLISDSYTKMDPSIDIKGKFNRRWRIEDNVHLEEVIQTIET